MKFTLLLGFLFLVASCGKSAMDGGASSSSSNPLTTVGACSNSIVNGRWVSVTNSGLGLTFTSDCRYINEFCKSTGTYPANVISDTGTVLINVDSKAAGAPAQCLPIGTFGCQYQINKSVTPNQLGVLCGNVWGIYNKQ